MEFAFFIGFLGLLALLFVAMMGLIMFAGVIEGRLPPEKQGKPYHGARPKDYRTH